MAETTASGYIQHHLQNLTFGQLPDGGWGFAHTVAEAQQRAYQPAGRIKWDGVFYRKDIGWRAIAREQE